MRMSSFLVPLAARWRAARTRHLATRELAAMSVGELGDLGITRLDVSRVFEPRLASEFRSRGAARFTIAAAFTSSPRPGVVRANLESLA